MKAAIIVFVFLFGSITAHLRDKAQKIYIGAALAVDHLRDDPKFNQLAAEEFNSFTPEYEMKWKETEPTRGNLDYVAADTLVKFGQENDLKVRGHTLVWHEEVPLWVSQLSGDALQEALTEHINNEVTHFKGQIYAWDVVNEVINEDGTLRNTIWYSNFGEDFIVDSFSAVRAIDPDAKLYINDYNVEGVNAKSNGLYELVKRLVAAGAPVDGVGFQTHLSTGGVPADFQENLERFAALDLDIAITEVDIKSNGDEEQQANDYAAIVKVCLAVPRCVGVTLWGITDKYSWEANTSPLPWDSDYRAKPAVAALEDALE